MRQDQFVHDELVQEFYGLDSETMLVACASITKSGRMHRWTEAGGYLSAQLSGPSVQAEVTRHFGLIYLVAVQPDATVELRQQVMRGLRATARLLRNYEMPWTRPFDVQSPPDGTVALDPQDAGNTLVVCRRPIGRRRLRR